MSQAETGSALWIKEQAIGLVEGPYRRKEIREAVRLLSNGERIRAVLSSDDPWRGIWLQEAVQDLPTSWEGADDEMQWAFRSDDEREALRRLDRAITEVRDASGADLVTGIELIDHPAWAAVEAAARELLELMSVDDAPPPLPSGDVVEAVLRTMMNGEVEGDLTHAWAGQWACREPFSTGDPVWHALWRICYWWGKGAEAPARWIENLRAGMLDVGLIANLTLTSTFAREELGAYTIDTKPKESTEPSDLNISIIYWEAEGLTAPSEGERHDVSATLWRKLVDSGFPEEALSSVSLEVADYGKGLSEYWPGFKGWGSASAH